ncbi:hypothetical protein PGAG_00074 [Phaeocystis globosa virus 12T]|nr:hypothetical protein PGAG_00074 [Phaeocystis globosa virus 12T]AET73782.1 hypothetical protein PGBG_00074 [Phaeocystis globosa virus 14T]
MSNLFNFGSLFSNPDNSNKLPKSLVNKKFDEFIKESFGTYLYKAASFNNYAKVYEENTDFSDECKELYILSEELYLNAVQKIKVPFDVKFNTSKEVYIFNLNDIHNDDFMYKNNANQRVIRPKKQKYLCKIVAINFVKLYILIKGIYSTFNHNLNHPELAAKKKRARAAEEPIIEDIDEPIEVETLDEPIEVEEIADLDETVELVETPDDEENINQKGGGMFDDIRNLFTGNSTEKSENVDTENAYDEELNGATADDNDDVDENEDEDEDTDDKPSKKIKYNNVFYAFINAIFESPIDETETNLNMEFPDDLNKFTENLHTSGVFDILCDTDYIYSTLKKNILFNPNNMNKVYKTSPKILQKIKNLETDLLKQYNSKLNSKDDELKQLFEEFKQYDKLCKKLTSNFSANDETRVYERIIKIVKTMFTDYTSNRNKLFNEIILNIFEFNEKVIKDSEGNVIGVENNIIRIKDNITYKEIVKLTSNSKIIIYDLHIGFFKDLLKIFELLNEKNLIVSGEIKAPAPEIIDKPENDDEKDDEKDDETDDETDDEIVDESDDEVIDEPEPETEVVDEPIEVVDEEETEVVDEPKPEVVDEPKPEVVDEPIEVVDEPEPKVVEEPESKVVEEPSTKSQKKGSKQSKKNNLSKNGGKKSKKY